MTRRKSGVVRIIGGQWRRRLLPIANIPGVRPTSDRIRETLFNWLMPYIKAAACLDLFAGSGALGFEALSRGADCVSFIDGNHRVIQQLKQSAQILGISEKQFEIIQGIFPENRLPLSFGPYDIVFLDPPYHEKRLLPLAAEWLESNNYLADSGLIYVEMEKQRQPPQFLKWRLVKKGQTSRISYYLFQRGNDSLL